LEFVDVDDECSRSAMLNLNGAGGFFVRFAAVVVGVVVVVGVGVVVGERVLNKKKNFFIFFFSFDFFFFSYFSLSSCR
jgi:hypothetical protein